MSATTKTRKPRVTKEERERDRLRMVAAATDVVREIGSSESLTERLEEVEGAWAIRVVPLSVELPTEVVHDGKAEWRMIRYIAGHRFLWDGAVRVGHTGQILFVVRPEMNAELTARGVSIAELAHTDLERVFGRGIVNSLTDCLGATIEELIAAALDGVDEASIESAGSAKLVEREIVTDMRAVIPSWGQWA